MITVSIDASETINDERLDTTEHRMILKITKQESNGNLYPVISESEIINKCCEFFLRKNAELEKKPNDV